MSAVRTPQSPTLRGEAISEPSVYCTGDWLQQRQRDHAQAVKLLR